MAYTRRDFLKTAALSVTVLPKNSGVGSFGIGGSGPAGGVLGEVLAPTRGEFGAQRVPVHFQAGKEATITWRV